MHRLIILLHSAPDRPWAQLMRRHLRSYADCWDITVWTPDDIAAGERARAAAEAAIARGDTIVLLVSPGLLAEEFIDGNELETRVRASRDRGVPVLWVPVSHSAHACTSIGGYLPIHDPELPLDGLSPAALNRALTGLCDRIVATLPTPESLPKLLAGCIPATELLSVVLPSLGVSPDTAPPLAAAGRRETWFAAVVAICEDRGLLGLDAFWTALQRIRPVHCIQLHEHRRRRLPREREVAAPRMAAIERLAGQISQRWGSAGALQELLRGCGCSRAIPAHSSVLSLVHWALAELVRTRQAEALFRLATALRYDDPAFDDAATTLERLAVCACDREVPSAVSAAWIDLRRGPDGVALSFRSWDPPVSRDEHVQAQQRGSSTPLGLSLSLAIEMGASPGAVELQLRAKAGGPWLGKTLRLCHGITSLARRLLASGGDHLGPEAGEVLVLVEELSLTEAP